MISVGGERGCDGRALAPPTGSRGPLFIDQRLKESDFRVLFYSNSLILYQKLKML